MWPYLSSVPERDNTSCDWHSHVEGGFKSHPNWHGAVSISEVLSGCRQVPPRTCVCLFVCVRVLRSHFYIASDALRGTPAPAARWESILDIYYALHQSFLDSWHFTSWTNCQLSKLNFKNDMLKFTPRSPNPLSLLCLPLPPLAPLFCMYFLFCNFPSANTRRGRIKFKPGRKLSRFQ